MQNLSFEVIFYSLFLLVSNIKSFHSSPAMLIIFKYLKVIFSLHFSSRTKLMGKKKKRNHYSPIPTRNSNNCLSDLHNNMRDLSKAEFL